MHIYICLCVVGGVQLALFQICVLFEKFGTQVQSTAIERWECDLSYSISMIKVPETTLILGFPKVFYFNYSFDSVNYVFFVQKVFFS
jgi:hypothetical protein